MTGAGPDPFEGGPEGSDGSEGDLGDHDEPFGGLVEAAPSGWIPPEKRAWRHPSEVFARALEPVGPASGAAGGMPARGPGRRWTATAFVGGGAAAAVLAGVLLLLQVGAPGGRAPSPAARHVPFSALTAITSPVEMARSTAQAMVLLRVTTASGTKEACAVAVEEGGLLATPANVVEGARRIEAVTADGSRVRAKVLGLDAGSDVALLEVPQALPVAPFDQSAEPAAGGRAMVMAVTDPPGNRRLRAALAPTVISSPAAAVTHGSPTGLAVVVATPSAPAAVLPGAALVLPDGQVLGIYDPSGTTAGTGWVFLPSYLVVGVSSDLAASGHVDHGWLGIYGAASPGQSPTTTAGKPSPQVPGALATTVDPNGPAATAVHPGDVVVAIDGYQVRSMAELRSRLYVMPPGSNVRLVVWHGGRETSVDLDLASSP
ncbi:MAG: S1C family serine protease [Acidimicrobiales bacterium]